MSEKPTSRDSQAGEMRRNLRKLRVIQEEPPPIAKVPLGEKTTNKKRKKSK